MSMNQEYWNPQQAPPSQGSGCGKLLLGVGVGCGLAVLLVIAAVVALGFFAHRWFKQSMNQDPAVVREVTARMADIEVPEGLNPSFAFTPTMPFGKAQEVLPSNVMYMDPASNSMLMLMEFGKGANPQGQAQFQLQMDNTMRKQAGASMQDMKEQSSSTKEIKIGDQPTKFTFTKGVSADKRNRLDVRGSFEGKSGLVMLMFTGDADKYNEATLTKMLESIKVK